MAGELLRRVRQFTSRLNDAGEANNEYVQGEPPGKKCMDDHCDGIWVKPEFNGIDNIGQQLTNIKMISTSAATWWIHIGQL